MGARLSLLPHCPLAPCTQEVVGTQIHTKLFTGIWEQGPVSWEWGEWQQGLGSEGSYLGVRRASFSLFRHCPLAPCPQRWWKPQYILSCSLDIGSEVQQGGSDRSKVRGVMAARFSLLPHCPLAPCPQRWWEPQYILSCSLDIASEVQRAGSEGSDGSKVELAPTLPPSPLPPRGGRDPNTY